MKKQKNLKTVGIVKRLFNVREWLDYDRIRVFTRFLGDGIKKMVVPKKENVDDKEKSFSLALQEMNLTEQQLTERGRGLLRLCILMCLMAVGILVYTGFHLYSGNYKAAIVSFVISLIALTLGFRYHFWYFQIKERKLGCSFREWFHKGLLGRQP